MKLVSDCANDVFNLGREQLLQSRNCDRRVFLPVLLLNLLLVIKNGCNLCVVIPIFVGRLPIVQINQHVSQVLMQSVLNIVCRACRRIVRLRSLLLLILLLLLLLSTILLCVVSGSMLMRCISAIVWLLILISIRITALFLALGALLSLLIGGICSILRLMIVTMRGTVLTVRHRLLIGALVTTGRLGLVLCRLLLGLMLHMVLMVMMLVLLLVCPGVLIFDFITQVIVLAIFWSIASLLISVIVFFFTFLLTFFFIDLYRHVLLLTHLLLLLLLLLVLLLLLLLHVLLLLLLLLLFLLSALLLLHLHLGVLTLFFVDEVVHGHDGLLTVATVIR